MSFIFAVIFTISFLGKEGNSSWSLFVLLSLVPLGVRLDCLFETFLVSWGRLFVLNFLLRTALALSHGFWNIVFPFSFQVKWPTKSIFPPRSISWYFLRKIVRVNPCQLHLLGKGFSAWRERGTENNTRIQNRGSCFSWVTTSRSVALCQNKVTRVR